MCLQTFSLGDTKNAIFGNPLPPTTGLRERVKGHLGSSWHQIDKIGR